MSAGSMWQPVAAGCLSAFVGFASTFALVAEGLRGVGASPAEAASGLMAVSVSMGLCGVFLSLKYRLPISVAWSTPGAALLATGVAVEGGFAAATGAFMIAAILVIIAGMWKTLGRWISMIPTSVAQAMLAGVLMPLCLAPFEAIAAYPIAGLAILVAWFLVGRWNRLLAMPAAVAVAAGAIWFLSDLTTLEPGRLLVQPILVMPEINSAALLGIALPLFIVTMASQNVPGIAVLNSFDYRPEPGPLFSWTGVFSFLSAPFGGHAVNLAAITAALCAGPDAHPDRDRRYISAVVAGLLYTFFGLTAGGAVAFIALAPPILVKAVAGLALFGAFTGAVMGAVGDEKTREAAILTFLVTASGLTVLGIGGAFWGLIVGIAVHFVVSRTKSD